MRCRKENIHFYLDHQLSQREQEELEDHLQICRPCQKRLRKIRRAKQLLVNLAPVEPSFGFLSTLETRREREKARKMTTQRLLQKRSFPGWLIALPLAASLLLALYFLFTFLLESQRIDPKNTIKKNSQLTKPPKEKTPKNTKGPKIANSPKLNLPKIPSLPGPTPPTKKTVVVEKIPPQIRPKLPKNLPPVKVVKKQPKGTQPGKTTYPRKLARPKIPVPKIKTPSLPPRQRFLALAKKYTAPKASLQERSALLAQMETISIPEVFAFLKRVLRLEPSPLLRCRAVLTLGSLGTVEGVQTMMVARMDSSWMVQDSLESGLKRLSDGPSQQWVTQHLLFSKDKNLRQLAISALSKIGSLGTGGELARAYRKEPYLYLKAKILMALGELHSYDQIPLIQKACRFPQWRIRQFAALAVGKMGRESLIPILSRLLRDNNPLVRKAAILSLGKFPRPDVVAQLEKILQKTRDLDLAGAALTSLTALEGKARKERKGLPSLYGISLLSNRILFLVDVSDSMKKSLPLLQKILNRAISALPSRSSFNIVLFSTRLDRFSRHFVPARPHYKQKAYRFIAKIKIHHQLTDLHKSLLVGLQLGPRMIFLISDGSSTAGKFYQYPEKILEEFQKNNFFQRTRVHTLGLFRSDQNSFVSMKTHPIKGEGVSFLRKLSQKNRGAFLHNYHK